MASDLQPYKVTIFKPDYYSFITDSGDKYICYFSPYDFYFKDYPKIASKVFDFNITKKNSAKKSFGTDKRIADTVISIVSVFLLSKINAVVYLCDLSDGKASVRARKFKTWFSYYKQSSEILQLNVDIEQGDQKIYTALLVHRKNKLRFEFIKAFTELTDFDNNK